ncbi:MAG: hypothetical protein A3F40_05125 [Chlamydiae bacterium RIFCSPHIGHO2_12_FULL_27_8]|nr:MAG: hypothetical protein A3F40_05125 [Chlamydiae bacterium RIFCSPHIGHO2_12_FULL_27_8]
MEDKLKEKKTFNANLKNVYPMLIWIGERIAKYFNQKEQEKIELACEEVFVNIVKHGYKNKVGTIHLEIIVNSVLEIIFVDSAKKFDIFTQKKKINKKESLKDKKIGGLGIYLIFQTMDEVIYKRKPPHNILKLIKKRSMSY